MRYLVTGGAGFIGSNFIRYLFDKYGDDAQVVNLDKLTYAGIRENLAEYEGKPNYRFLQGDIAKPEDVAEGYKGVDGSGVDVVVNFAAETHVDRSLMEAGTFIETDVHGVLVLLEEAKKLAPNLKRFVQISTDEVYGSIDAGSFTESDPLNPRNPYSARFSRMPAYVSLSRFTTWASSPYLLNRKRMKFDPMNPAPPVTR